MSTDWRTLREQSLLALEKETNPLVRAEAAEALCEVAADLGEAAAPELAPVVVRLLSDRQSEVRAAGLALGAQVSPPDEAEALLVRHLADANERVRVEAAGRLADLALPSSRGSLAAAMQDPAFSVRFEAARGMAALQHSAGLDVLLEGLNHADFRFRALSALAQLNDPAALPRVRALFKKWFLPAFDRTLAAAVLGRLGDQAGVDHLYARAAKRWTADRAMAIELLGELKVSGARARLEQIAKDPVDTCRGAAARALGRLGDIASAAVLMNIAREGGANDDLKLDAAEGLWALGTDEAKSFVRGLELRGDDAKRELNELLNS